MKSNASLDVVHLPPKPPPTRIPSDPHSYDASRYQGDKAAVSPRQNREPKVKVKTSRWLLPSDDGEDTMTDPDQPPPDSGKKSSGIRPNVDFSVLRQTRKSESDESGQTMTSPNENNSDVIYDEPFAEFESRSLKSMIKSDGYIRLRADVIEATELLRKKTAAARQHRKSCLRGPPGKNLSKLPLPLPRSRSTESLDVHLDFTTGCSYGGDKTLRSSFVDPNGPPTRRSVYLDLGDYQTLLKYSRNEDERVYSLPQPQCYGDETLRAVRQITQKYDTLKRRQLRDLSFRDGATGTNARRSRDEDRTPAARVPPVDGSSDAPSAGERSSPVSVGVESVVGPDESSAVHHNGSAEKPEADGVQPDVDPFLSKRLEEIKETKTSSSSSSSSPQSRKSGWSSLRDYCNSLEETDDLDDVIEGGLSRSSLIRIELFYRSRESSVYVARGLADLLVGSSAASDVPMVHQHTGVPVWILNSGLGIRRRELLLVLAERETGLPLWRDRISYLSEYQAITPSVHRLRVSGSLCKSVELHMSCERSGEEFLATFRQMASDPNDDLWKVSAADSNRKSNKKTTGNGRKKRQKLSKLSISQPCNFVRLSCVDPSDANFCAAFYGLVPLANKTRITATKEDFSTACDTVECGVTDSAQCEFRPRLPTR